MRGFQPARRTLTALAKGWEGNFWEAAWATIYRVDLRT